MNRQSVKVCCAAKKRNAITIKPSKSQSTEQTDLSTSHSDSIECRKKRKVVSLERKHTKHIHTCS